MIFAMAILIIVIDIPKQRQDSFYKMALRETKIENAGRKSS